MNIYIFVLEIIHTFAILYVSPEEMWNTPKLNLSK